jgi:integrase/recombinase XerD
MANTVVRLNMRVIVDGQQRYCPAVFKNGRVRQWGAMVNGVAERHEGATYSLAWYEGKKLRRKAVGKDADRAHEALKKKQAELRAVAHGVEVVPDKDKGSTVEAAMEGYLDEIKSTKKPRTFSSYSLSLGYFKETCSKRYVSEIERGDLLTFKVALRDTMELAPRTVWNHFSNVVSFLKALGRTGLAKKGDWPTYTEEEPEAYEPEDLEVFFSACDPKERLLFQFFLMTGFREQEVQYLTWRDVNSTASTVSVQYKIAFKWSPKAYKERSVPIPRTFMEELLASKPVDAKPGDLVFPAPEGGPDGHMLRILKGVVTRAGLNPEEWWLHKFRSTYATTCLQNGVDLKTVQSWLGHSDLASTMRYLKAARGAAVQAKVESIWNYGTA